MTEQTPSELARIVQTRINSIAKAANHAVTIVAEGSTIALTGTIGSRVLKDQVERVAREVPGVTAVKSDLMVHRPADPSIADIVRDAIARQTSMHIKALSVEVRDGIVTIHGVADSRRSIEHAVATAHVADGVEDVISELLLETTEATSGGRKGNPSTTQ
jgi:osmotically-inducible protein OsmY